MTMSRTPFFASMLAAGIVATAATAVAWTSQAVPAQEESSNDTVRAFMVLGTSTRRSPGAPPASPTNAPTECVPCQQHGTEPVTSRVPSRPPPHPVDGAFERITGRSQQFTLPSESGKAVRSTEYLARGWVMLLTGLPVAQTTCFMVIENDHLHLSRFSGTSQLGELKISLLEQTPATLNPDARVLVDAIKAFVRLNASPQATWSREIQLNGFTIASVAPQDIYVVPAGTTWTTDAQDDIHLRLTPQGRISQFENVRARGRGEHVVASRVVWFPEYTPR